MGVNLVEEKVRGLRAEGNEIPDSLVQQVEHMILAHHGQYEFGSPKLPAMPEAIAIHYLDNLDAKLHMYLDKIERDPDPASDWTQYVRSLETKIYKKDVMGTRDQ